MEPLKSISVDVQQGKSLKVDLHKTVSTENFDLTLTLLPEPGKDVINVKMHIEVHLDHDQGYSFEPVAVQPITLVDFRNDNDILYFNSFTITVKEGWLFGHLKAEKNEGAKFMKI